MNSLTILEKPHVVAAERLYQLLSHIHLPEGELVVVAVVEDVQQVCVERMDVLQKKKECTSSSMTTQCML